MAIIASGTAPPNMPECEACSRVRTRSVKRVLPRSETVRAGVLSSQLPESATTITSARRSAALSERNCANEREPGLLLALEEQHDAEVEVRSDRFGQRAERGDVRHDPGLVVGGAAAVQAAAADRRLEGRRLPERLVADRLHVMVGVEQDRRPAVARRPGGEDGGLPRFGGLRDGRSDGCRRSRRGRCRARARPRPRRCAARSRVRTRGRRSKECARVRPDRRARTGCRMPRQHAQHPDGWGRRSCG